MMIVMISPTICDCAFPVFLVLRVEDGRERHSQREALQYLDFYISTKHFPSLTVFVHPDSDTTPETSESCTVKG